MKSRRRTILLSLALLLLAGGVLALPAVSTFPGTVTGPVPSNVVARGGIYTPTLAQKTATTP